MLKNHPSAVFLLSLAGLLVAGCVTQSPAPAAAITTPTLAPTARPESIPTMEPTVVPTLEPALAQTLAPTATSEPTFISAPDFAALPGNAANAEPSPDFTVTTLTGEPFTLSDHRGSPVLLTFMANGCPSCIYEITSFAETYPTYVGQGLVTLVVDIQGFDTPADLQPYVDSLPYPEVNWTIDGEFRVGQLYNVFNPGVTVLIDPAGRIVYRDNRPTGPEDFRQLLSLALP